MDIDKKTFYFDKVQVAPEDRAKFESLGGIVSDSVDNKLNYLVTATLPGVGAKFLRAAAYKISVITLAEFQQILK